MLLTLLQAAVWPLLLPVPRTDRTTDLLGRCSMMRYGSTPPAKRKKETNLSS